MCDALPDINILFYYFALLEEWSNRTKQKPPNKLYEIGEAMLRGMSETWCSACSLQLSSRIVAISHYQGKDYDVEINVNVANNLIIFACVLLLVYC